MNVQEFIITEENITKKAKQDAVFAICRICFRGMKVPKTYCNKCKRSSHDCAHGWACSICSYKEFLKTIERNSVEASRYPSDKLEIIKKNIKDKFDKEIFINKKGYLEVKRTTSA